MHVGQNDRQPIAIREKYGHRLQIGWSLEDRTQLDSKQMAAVDHLGVSPIFPTKTKQTPLQPGESVDWLSYVI
ncbi:thiamine phosphate synthase [Sphingobacterium sp. E70]|nr:thiamine phosphate synthase [Sphingobacterium sp. E70]ULT23951.1 thiamine phosphate synthase [Sphingobacterium sp. E70]